MNHWLLKSEPEEYSWSQMCHEQETCWDGVKNHQALNNMKRMAVGDLALFYHTGKLREVVGIVEISRGFYCHERFGDVVNVRFHASISREVSLKEIKACSALQTMVILKQPRLSVVHISMEEWVEIITMSNNKI